MNPPPDIDVPHQTKALDALMTGIAGNYGWKVDATMSSWLKALLARRHLAPGARLCDAGCANGLFVRYLAPHCAHVTALDLNAAMLEQARIMVEQGGFRNIDLVRGDLMRLPLYWALWYRRRGHFGIRAFSYGGISAALRRLGLTTIEAHALGFCDQWKYVPGLHLLKGLERVFHRSPDPARNLDYRVSNAPGLFQLANRWYVVARKDAAG
jgi:SAM-dependent methyltransferase